MAVIVTGYKVLKKIQDGGFSSVWEALRTSDQTPTALKVLSDSGMQQSFTRSSFRNEGKMLLELEHEYIVRTFETTEDSLRHPVIAMEYFDSENLKRCILKYYDRVRKRSPEIMIKLAGALQYLHGLSIIHRDIKPENVLVNKYGAVRLIDFSLAIRIGGWAEIFRKRRIAGTPLYMSPEQIRKQKLDGRCDVYALGCVFFEVLTRRPPFIASTQEKLLICHCKEKPASPLMWQSEIPDKVCKLVLDMLKKKPEARPSLDDVIGTLQGLELELTSHKKK